MMKARKYKKIIRSTLLNNSMEVILSGFIYDLPLDKQQREILERHLQVIHFDLVKQAFQTFLQSQLEDVDLEKALHILAYWADPKVKIPEVTSQLDRISEEIKAHLPESGHPLSFIDHINFYLFDKYGFQGNSADYYNPHNNFLDKVLASNQGIPITLSALYILIAQRLGIMLSGVPMPAHFIVKYEAENDEIYIDPYFPGRYIPGRSV